MSFKLPIPLGIALAVPVLAAAQEVAVRTTVVYEPPQTCAASLTVATLGEIYFRAPVADFDNAVRSILASCKLLPTAAEP